MSDRNLTYRPSRIEFTPEWDTGDLAIARSGNEPQRQARRWAPRWGITYGISLRSEDEARWLKWMLGRYLGEVWNVPIWWESTRITEDSDFGPDIQGDFAASDLLQDDLAYILHKNGSAGELFTLSNVDTTSVTPADPLGAVYPRGSRVFLVVTANLRERQDIVRSPVNLAEMNVKVDVVRHRLLGGATAVLTEYRGLPVLDRLFVGRQFAEIHERGYSWFDSGGHRQRVLGWDTPRMTYPRTLRLPTRAELQWSKLLLDTLKGRRGQVWVPTWTSDFTLLGASPGASTFNVSDDPSDEIEAWWAAEQERHVQLRRLDGGDVVRRKVVSITDLGGGTLRLNLEAPLPADLPSLDQLRCSLLQLCRLDEDAVPYRFDVGLRAHLELVLRTLDEAATVTQYDASVAETVEISELVAAAAALVLAEASELVEALDVRTLANLSEATDVSESVVAAVLAQFAEATEISESVVVAAAAALSETIEIAEEVAVSADPWVYVMLAAQDVISNNLFENVDGFAIAVAASTRFMAKVFAFFDASDADVTSGMQFDGPASKVWFLAHYGFPGAFNRWPFDYNSGTGAAGFTGRGVAMARLLLETGGTAGTLQYKSRSTDGTDSVTYPIGCWIAVRSTGLVALDADVTNSGASSGTLADVDAGGGDALELALISGILYWFDFYITFSATAVTTGYRCAINGPAFTVCVNMVQIKIAANSQVRGAQAGYDDGGPIGTDSIAGGNLAYMEGVILPSASGDLIARHAAEANSLSVTTEAGSVAGLIPLTAGNPNVGIAGGDVTDNVGTLKDLTDCYVDVAAGEEVAFEIRVPWRTDTGATGIGFGLDCPGDYEELEAEVRIGQTNTAITVGRLGAPGDRVDCASATANTDRIAIITGYFRNGPTAGQLQVQFAREAAAGAGTVTAKANSAIMKHPF